MRAGIVTVDGMIVTATDDPARLHHHRANRNLAARESEMGLLKRGPHEKRIIRTLARIAWGDVCSGRCARRLHAQADF